MTVDDGIGGRRAVVAALEAAGCVAAPEEADELLAAAAGDRALLERLLDRRRAGEPLAWLVGSVRFCGETVLVDPGVYVPRWQTEPMARLAVARLPADGTAVDLCTGAGAIAVLLGRRRPGARVLATELDPAAVACARSNGVAVYPGDMAAGLPAGLDGQVDLVTGVVPYVPTEALHLLPRDVSAHEPRRALDGGEGGTRLLARAIADAATLLRPGGSLLLELGGDQAVALEPVLATHGYEDLQIFRDEEGDVRAVATRRSSATATES